MLVAFHQLKNLGCICYGLTNASSNKGELQSNPLCLAMTIQHSFGDANIYIYTTVKLCADLNHTVLANEIVLCNLGTFTESSATHSLTL